MWSLTPPVGPRDQCTTGLSPCVPSSHSNSNLIHALQAGLHCLPSRLDHHVHVPTHVWKMKVQSGVCKLRLPLSRPSSTHRLAFPDAVVEPLVSLIERILCSARWTSYDSSAIPCNLQPPPMNLCICSEENRFSFPQRQSSMVVSWPPDDALSLVSVLNHRGGFWGKGRRLLKLGISTR